uniref:GCS light chain n=1 Tax=Schistocephalus solidus TaxID=70667 RepID=A0A0X3NHG5_SCHSO
MPIIPSARTMFVHTSNVLKWNTRSLLKNPMDEPTKCIETVLHCWHKNTACKDLRTTEEINVACELHRDKIPDSERPDICVTAKVFLSTYDADAVRQAVNRTLDRLGLADIETLIVSVDPELSKAPITDVPPCMDFPSAKICKGTAESLLKVWPILEEFVKSNKVFRLGVCDMSADEMELLHSSVKIPPKVNQLFLGSSCLISDELQNFAKLHDVQLTTHQDSSDILRTDWLVSIISQEFSPDDATGWRPLWLVRYSEMFKHRGVIRSKGYTLLAERTAA